MASQYIQKTLETIRIGLGLEEEVFYDLTLHQLTTLKVGQKGDRKTFTLECGVKWTRAEIARIVADDDGRAAVEVLQYLDERGPRVVDWTEDEMGADGKPLAQDDDELDEAALSKQIDECEGEERASRRG